MIVVGVLAVWLVAIVLPGWSLPGLLLRAMMVAWAAFGLLTEG
jgi:hypothetical protein